MASSTNVVLSATGLSTTQNGNVFDVPARDKDYLLAQVDITAGTATVVVEGRTTPNAQWVTLQTFSATGAEMVARMPQIRFRVSAAAAATILGTVGEPVIG